MPESITDPQPGPHSGQALTQAQQLIWTGQALQPDEPLYNMALVFEIAGEINVVRFRAAFARLIADADALRTVFHGDSDAGQARQAVINHLSYELPFEDWRADKTPPNLRDWAQERAAQPLNLAVRTFDSALIQTTDSTWAWYFNQHHLVTDAWSMSILFRALSDRYQNNIYTESKFADNSGQSEASVQQSTSAEPNLHALPDFSGHVARSLARSPTASDQRARAFWQEQSELDVSMLTFYRAPGERLGGATRRYTRALSREQSDAVRKLSRDPRFAAMSQDMAVFQIFATILAACLHRTSRTLRVAIGTPAHNRPNSTAKATAGLFIEMFPLCCDVANDDTFTTLAQRIAGESRRLLLNARPGTAGAGSARSFQVVLNYITAAFGRFAGLPTRCDWIHAGHGDRQHLLRLQVHDFDDAGHFLLHFDLNQSVIDDKDAQDLQHCFGELLAATLRDPDQKVANVPLVTDAQVAAQIHSVKGKVSPVPELGRLLHQHQHSDNIAVLLGDAQYTHAELHAAAGTIARQLSRRATAQDTVVLLLPRSLELIATVLACLRLGIVYVPVDADHPADRVRAILDAASPTVLIASPATSTRAREITGGTIPVSVADLSVADLSVAELASTPETTAEIRPDLREHKPNLPTPEIDSSADAYVLFTSGSTGTPKGVRVSRRSLANYINWATRYYNDGLPQPTMALFTSPGFDLTVTSMLLPIAAGGRLVIYPERLGAREVAVQSVIDDNRVNLLKLTPAHLSLVQAMDLAHSQLKRLIVGGEELPCDLAANISRRLPGVRIFNEYGPTEATVGCTIHEYHPDTDKRGGVGIGRAIDNTEIYLLDHNRQPVQRGVVAELYVGGAGVATGYLGDNTLTAKRFTDNPYCPGERMYATGDLARLTADGTLEYLGRNDEQVKVRGVRVEPGEIAAALRSAPGVRDAVVLVRDTTTAPTAPFCVRCGLDTGHPDAQLDDAGVCQLCHTFERERSSAMAYFGNMDDLRHIAQQNRAKHSGAQDSIMLLSGGKDSTYALCKAVESGFNPLVFTLDNGYVSEQALGNVRRIVDRLGLELVIGKTAAMDAIFADSLTRFANVCNGCFKTIYTLSTNLAQERGIRTIITGLSRGQIFETRLAEFFKRRVFDPVEIDRQIIEARKVYHRMADAVSQHLDTTVFASDRVFEEVGFVDFYRYCDASLDAVYKYLRERIDWVRPSDTGRSTNCLINAAGIHVHKSERGFHNYALPYSWDVRLGHKLRDAARAELDDRIDLVEVSGMLDQVGYEIRALAKPASWRKQLVAYYTADTPMTAKALKAALADQLPAEMTPHSFVQVPQIPLTANGKVDRRKLAETDIQGASLDDNFVAPEGDVETALASIWEEILGLSPIGRDHDFFEVGGDSILNIQIVALARRRGMTVTPEQIFDKPTIAQLAGTVGMDTAQADQGEVHGEVPLAPVARRFFDEAWAPDNGFAQIVHLDVPDNIDTGTLQSALNHLLERHDGLRSRFWRDNNSWRQEILPVGAGSWPLKQFGHGVEQQNQKLQALTRFDIGKGALCQALLTSNPNGKQLSLAIHHLAVDAVSWWILIDDLERAYKALVDEQTLSLGEKTSSLIQWGNALNLWRSSTRLANQMSFWTEQTADCPPLPVDAVKAQNTRADTISVAVHLSPEATHALTTDVARTWRTQVPDVLLTALALSLSNSTGNSTFQVDIESHGREAVAEDTSGSANVDLLRTVGWFTSLYPLRISVADSGRGDSALTGALTSALTTALTTALRSVREQVRRVPDRGIGFGLLRNTHKSLSSAEAASDILFNYLGHSQRSDTKSRNLFPLAGALEVWFDPAAPRTHLLEVNAMILEGALHVEFAVGAGRHQRATVERWAGEFKSTLLNLITAAVTNPDTQPAPSDFPDANLSQNDLDDLIAEFAGD